MIKKIIIIVVILIASLLAYIMAPRPYVSFVDDLSFEYHDSVIDLDLLINQNESKYTELKFKYNEDNLSAFDLMQVGTHDINVEYRNSLFSKSDSFTIEIKDTQAPVIEGVKDIEIFVGSELNLDHIAVSDPVDGELEYAIEGIYDTDKAGEYDLEVVTEDKNGLSTREDFKLVVKEKPVVKVLVINKPSTNTPSNNVSNEVKATYVGGHIFVNKKYGLPASYNPGENKEARSKLNEMIHAMREMGMDIHTDVSGFRTYAYQKQLYDSYVAKDGVALADTYSARPGHSDHQTGLTFDLKHKNGQLMGKADHIKAAAEIEWVAQNAHKYGFIVRYPKEKDSITGYMYEPWHLRYLGSDASAVYSSGLTMEEYFNMEGGGYR